MAKRGASYQLTDRNWDDEDEPVEAGIFETATAKEMSKRVIRKAKRVRTGQGDTEEASSGTGPFSGFKGLVASSGGFQVAGTTSFKPLTGLKPGFTFGSAAAQTPQGAAAPFGFGSKPHSSPGVPGGRTASAFGHKATEFQSMKSSSTFLFGGGAATNGSEPKRNEDAETAPHFGNGDGAARASFKFEASTTDTPSPRTSPVKSQEYHRTLATLNRSVCDWITKHVDRNPLCDLTPVFGDYEKHLKALDDKYPHTSGSESEVTDTAAPSAWTFNTSLMGRGGGGAPASPDQTRSTGVPAAFEFRNDSSLGSSQSSLFGGAQMSSASQDASQDLKKEESGGGATNEDEPPKVEFTESTEDGAFYSKKCKLFVKKGANFSERGVGMLHMKTVDDRTQLLIRAGTTLGNLLLNIVLTPSTPVSRSGKNNVMLVCAPNPPTETRCPKCDKKYPSPSQSNVCESGCIADPATMLVRVKTAEDADELHDKINASK